LIDFLHPIIGIVQFLIIRAFPLMIILMQKMIVVKIRLFWEGKEKIKKIKK